MDPYPLDKISSGLAAIADLPLPLIAETFLVSDIQISANISPPMPVDMGSSTLSAAAVATAASTALPPFWRI
jgi:hypothetical protein